MAEQFCSSALQKLDKPGGATMSNFPGQLRRRSGVADNWRDPPGFTRNFSDQREPLSVGQVRHLIPWMGTPHLAAPETRSVGVAKTFFGSGRPTLPQPCRDAEDPINADQPTINESRYQDVSASGNGCSFRTQIRPRSRRSDHSGTDPDCRRPTHQKSERRISGSKGVRRTASRLQAPGSG